MNNEIMQKIAEEAFNHGYEEEMELLTKEAAPIPGSKSIWQGTKEMFTAAKNNAGTFLKDPGAAFGPQSWKGFVKTPEIQEGLKRVGRHAARNTPESRKIVQDAGNYFKETGLNTINHNSSALKGMGIVAGGTALTGLGGYAAVNALTPPKKVRVV